jgi:anti-sigma factor RsiW
VELVTEYLEGTLPEADRIRFEEHIARCSGCQAYLAQMRQVIRAMGKLSEDDIPTQAKADLLRVFRSWKR